MMAVMALERPTGTHERILAEAAELFAQRGYGATSTRDISAAVGIRQPSLFHHFANKAALFTAIAVEGFDRLADDLVAADGAVPAGSPAVDRIRAIARRYLRFATSHRGHFEVMWRTDLLHADDPGLITAARRAREVLIKVVAAAQAEGWAADRDARSAGFLAWSAVHGLATLWLQGALGQADERPFDEIADGVIDLLSAPFSR